MVRYQGEVPVPYCERAGFDPHCSKFDSSVPPSQWVDEKAYYPGDRSNIAEIAGGSVSFSELPGQRGQKGYSAAPYHEMYDPSAPAARPMELPTEIMKPKLQSSIDTPETSLPRQKSVPTSHRSLKDRWSKRQEQSHSSILLTDKSPPSVDIVSPLSGELQASSSGDISTFRSTPSSRADVPNGRYAASPEDLDHYHSNVKVGTDPEQQSHVVCADENVFENSRILGPLSVFQSATRLESTVSYGTASIPPASPIHDRPGTPRSTPTRSQIEELRHLVWIVHHEWMQRLASDRELLTICSVLPVRDLFDRGLRSLEQFFHGNILTTFEDTFALMHIAFAAAYAVHRNDESYLWSAFFQDALWWQSALSSQSDRHHFRNAMDRWWRHSGKSPVFLTSDAPSNLLWPPLDSSTSGTSLLTVLRAGKIMQACSYFLDRGSSFDQ